MHGAETATGATCRPSPCSGRLFAEIDVQTGVPVGVVALYKDTRYIPDPDVGAGKHRAMSFAGILNTP